MEGNPIEIVLLTVALLLSFWLGRIYERIQILKKIINKKERPFIIEPPGRKATAGDN